MAKRVHISMTDDLDGTEDAETVQFATTDVLMRLTWPKTTGRSSKTSYSATSMPHAVSAADVRVAARPTAKNPLPVRTSIGTRYELGLLSKALRLHSEAGSRRRPWTPTEGRMLHSIATGKIRH